MKLYYKISMLLFLALLLSSCSSIQTSIDEKYQPLGTAVLAANDLFIVKYYSDNPVSVSGTEYKELLKESYIPMYERLAPYIIQIEKKANTFIVFVYDDELLILKDWLCTEGRIDCWCYNEECDPDEFDVECQK